MPKLEELNEAQQRAATHIHGPCVVMAGAGSGKTAMLVTRVEQLMCAGVDPRKILCCTFTVKATKEMKERIVKHVGSVGKQVVVSTIHGLAWRMVRQQLQDWKLVTNTQWIYEVVLGPKSKVNRFGTGLEKEITVDDAMTAIGKAKNSKQFPNDIDDPVVQHVFEAYELFKRERKMLDFDDILIKANEFMQDADFAYKMQNRFTHVSVDEFQDVNLIQWELLQKIVEPHRNIFVVGDPDQSIYGFRGSRPELILAFGKYYNDAETVILDRNYRSREPVIRASNRIIAINPRQMKKRLVAHRHGGEPVRIINSREEFEQVHKIADTIQSLRTAFTELTWSDFAVLYRTNQEAIPFEEVLMERNIPYELSDGTHFYQNYKVASLIAYMRFLEALNNDVLPDMDVLVRALKNPRGFLSGDAIRRVQVDGPGVMLKHQDYRQYMANLEKLLKIDKPLKFTETLSECYPQLVETEPGEVWLESFRRAITRFDTLRAFLQHVDYSIEKAKEPKDDAIKLMSIHAAKGLEFGTVFLVNMVEGLIPYQKAVDEGNLDEETRLAYVGMTRAKDRLYLCVPKTIGNKPCIPSRYVDELKGESRT